MTGTAAAIAAAAAIAGTACGGRAAPPPAPAIANAAAAPDPTPQQVITELIARWDGDAPLSDHAVTIAIHCTDGIDASDDRSVTAEPDMVNAMIVQHFGPVTRCGDQCCEVVPDPARPDVVVRELCLDGHRALDRIEVDGMCRGD